METILISVLFVSISLCAFLAYQLKIQRKKRPLSVSAEEVLGDLLRGNAIVRVERISPADVLLRSPRQ